mgnify:CR=1 FL=1
MAGMAYYSQMYGRSGLMLEGPYDGPELPRVVAVLLRRR